MTGPVHRPPTAPKRAPQLAVAWESRSGAFWSSVRALLYGPTPPRGWPTGSYFRDAWLRFKFPARALFASVLLHVALFNFPFFFPAGSGPSPKIDWPRIEITYYGPLKDLPPLAPKKAAGAPRQPSPPGEPQKPLSRRGADALARQSIISAPLKATHPRQTLIQPEAPQEPPKILPSLPNIVQWSKASRPARPRLQIDPSKLRARVSATRRVEDVAAPQLQNSERAPGPMNIASSPVVVEKPKLAVSPAAVPRAGTQTAGNDVTPAPDLGATFNGGDPGLRNLIALSAAPAPPAPVLDVPPGNLRANVTLSPDGTQSGVPGGAPNGVAGGSGGAGGGPGSPGGVSGGGGTQPGTGGAGGSGAGPEGISITGGDPKNTSNVSGNGTGTPGARTANPLLRAPLPDRPTRQPGTPGTPSAAKPDTRPALEKYTPGAPPEVILGPKRIYTLNVNMPNLTSVTGSWILQFAELEEDGKRRDTHSYSPPRPDLAGPVPLQKVDPKYPPALRSARIEGEVVLYAIIRKDGSVDSIQLVKGIDPRLDQNAMEALALWKFRPAERFGQAVELEAVVRIPFRVMAPF